MGKYEEMLASAEGFEEEIGCFDTVRDDDLVASDESGSGFSCEIGSGKRRKKLSYNDRYCQSDDEGGGYI